MLVLPSRVEEDIGSAALKGKMNRAFAGVVVVEAVPAAVEGIFTEAVSRGTYEV
jgi:hypothetical protein